MIRSTLFALGIAAVFVFMLFVGPNMAEQERPCNDDVQALCKDVTPGGGRIIDCLQDNMDKLSAKCKAHITDMRKQLLDACGADIKANCKDVKPGQGRILKCLKDNEAKLSAPCKAKLNLD